MAPPVRTNEPVVRSQLSRRSALGILLGGVAIEATESLRTNKMTLAAQEPATADVQLWDKIVRPYLEADLWAEDRAYDAGNYLMVPLHAAFALNVVEWQQQIAAHAERLVAHIRDGGTWVTNRMARMQFLYLWSRFLALATTESSAVKVHSDLREIIEDEVRTYWEEAPAPQWERDPFPGGMRERVLWKLDNHTVEKSYFRAVIEEELVTSAIAADLRQLAGTDDVGQIPDVISDILEITNRVFRDEVSATAAGGWLLQPGVWSDHPDYAYAGRSEKVPGMSPLPVSGIATDSAHSHRLSRWLLSLWQAQQSEPEIASHYEQLIAGLDRQLFDVVLVPPTEDFPSYRTTNFMDGSNGVYRWGYETQGTNNGYGPYELSGTFTLGWWSFLGTKRILDVYRDLAATFPLPDGVIDTYVGPNTKRERHPLAAEPVCYQNGFRELMVRLASKWELTARLAAKLPPADWTSND
ncbi:MAG: hypothetical protein ACRDJH_10345 [Thermomicrobiales bacterium]